MRNMLIGFVFGLILTAVMLHTAPVVGQNDQAFGGYDPACPADITSANQGPSDGMVDVFDLLLVLDEWGRCDPCVPSCAGAVCGDDGCGGSCGTCGIGETCLNGICVPDCIPNCAGLECGDDGCGGSCGTCGIGQVCRNGICVPE